MGACLPTGPRLVGSRFVNSLRGFENMSHSGIIGVASLLDAFLVWCDLGVF